MSDSPRFTVRPIKGYRTMWVAIYDGDAEFKNYVVISEQPRAFRRAWRKAQKYADFLNEVMGAQQ